MPQDAGDEIGSPISGVHAKTYIEAMREIRRSSAAQPHRNKAKYTRKTKHRGKNP